MFQFHIWSAIYVTTHICQNICHCYMAHILAMHVTYRVPYMHHTLNRMCPYICGIYEMFQFHTFTIYDIHALFVSTHIYVTIHI